MRETTATEAKNRFGQLIDMAMIEPVAIDKKGRHVAVMLSYTEYSRLAELDDRYWGEKALSALQNGFVAEEQGNQWLQEKLHAKTED